MYKKLKLSKFLCFLALFLTTLLSALEKKGKHLFILSGQSNMELLNPEESFNPTLFKEFGRKNVITVKFAKGTQPIRRWYRNWKLEKGDEPKAEPYLYSSLMTRVKKAINKKKIATITFVWMQGERDARKSFGNVYEKSLLGLYQQLSDDLGRKNINFVIGRLSDCGITKKGWPDWSQIRNIQVKVAESNSRFGWINTDDLNTGINRKGQKINDDIHMTAIGYKIMGERFAKEAVKLLENNN